MGDIQAIYDIFCMLAPRKMKVAAYLVYQFEHANFNFDVVIDEWEL